MSNDDTIEAAPACPHCGSDDIESRTQVVEVKEHYLCAFEGGEYQYTVKEQQIERNLQQDPVWICRNCNSKFTDPVPHEDDQ